MYSTCLLKSRSGHVVRRVTVLLLFIVACAAFFQSNALGQVYSGSLTGVTTDPSGSVVPGAKAMLTDQQKGFTFSATTDSEGRYVLRNLPPGTYTLSASAKGMRTYTQPGITLTVGQNFEAPIKFEIEGTTVTVNIAETMPLVSTQDASTGQIVNQRFINDLPLVSRNAFNLTMLSPGVTQAPGGSFGLNSGSVNFISNGGPQLGSRRRDRRRQPDKPGKQ